MSFSSFSNTIKSMYPDALKCSNRMKRYYFDNNSTTWVPDNILRHYLEYVNCGNPSNIHHVSGRLSAKAIQKSKDMIAADLSVAPLDIVFTACATESNNAIIQGLVHAHAAVKKPLHILTSCIEHKCVLETVTKMVESDNCGILSYDTVPLGSDGTVTWNAIKSQLRPETGLVCVMYANNETGIVQPVEEIGRKLRAMRPDIHFHVDAVAAIGKRIIKPRGFCHSMSFSGHKIHAVKGVGCLYIDQEASKKLMPLTFGGRQQVVRSGTDNTAAIWCMANALALVHQKRREKNNRLWRMRGFILNGLKRGGVQYKVFGSESSRKRQLENTLLIAIYHDTMCNLKLVKYLDSVGVSVSIGSSCNTKSAKASHVLNAMGATNADRRGTIRITMSDYTTMDDCKYLVQHLVRGCAPSSTVGSTISLGSRKNPSTLQTLKSSFRRNPSTSLSNWNGPA